MNSQSPGCLWNLLGPLQLCWEGPRWPREGRAPPAGVPLWWELSEPESVAILGFTQTHLDVLGCAVPGPRVDPNPLRGPERGTCHPLNQAKRKGASLHHRHPRVGALGPSTQEERPLGRAPRDHKLWVPRASRCWPSACHETQEAQRATGRRRPCRAPRSGLHPTWNMPSISSHPTPRCAVRAPSFRPCHAGLCLSLWSPSRARGCTSMASLPVTHGLTRHLSQGRSRVPGRCAGDCGGPQTPPQNTLQTGQCEETLLSSGVCGSDSPLLLNISRQDVPAASGSHTQARSTPSRWC